MWKIHLSLLMFGMLVRWITLSILPYVQYLRHARRSMYCHLAGREFIILGSGFWCYEKGKGGPWDFSSGQENSAVAKWWCSGMLCEQLLPSREPSHIMASSHIMTQAPDLHPYIMQQQGVTRTRHLGPWRLDGSTLMCVTDVIHCMMWRKQ